MTARTNTSIRLSADERRRLLEWGPDLASAVRRVLDVLEVEDLQPMPLAPVPALRERVRAKMRRGRTAGDIAKMLGVSRQSVEYHMRKIREGA